MTAQPHALLTALPAHDWSAIRTHFLFFTGKGGVGKTSVASATALRLADAGRTVLLVSTDPASNLDDVFGMAVGTSATPVPGAPRLAVMNLDPEAAAAAYRERMVGPYRGVLPAAALRSMEEQLSGACTVEIAAFNEFTSLLAERDVVARYDHIVFDTAPTGHTLRLLTLPSAWTEFMATNSTGVSCLGPLAGLEAQRVQYADTVQALADATRTTLVLVSRPDESALREAARASGELSALGITNQRLILNGVFTAPTGGDAVAESLVERQLAAMAGMPGALRDVPTTAVPLVATDLTGVAALRALAGLADISRSGDAAVPATSGVETLLAAPELTLGDGGDLADLVTSLEAAGHGVIMTMGKGGVGKTTLATAIAIALAERGHSVHLTTTDPAAHLLETVGADQPIALTVSRIDPAVETARYTDEMIAAAGVLDDESRALLEEDLRSPCTEEIAVFRAFAQVVDEARDSFVVLDTAPTGHTLLLLDAAESYHREVARSSGAVPDAVRALLPRLRDPDFTRILLVTLAEATPVYEAGRLQDDLRRAGIEPYGWVVNASLAASGTTHAVLAARARLEWPQLRRVQEQLATHYWVVPWRATSLVGAEALLALSDHAR
ncbi:MAG TPA: arsenical pump-driving ATPase [Gemmatimonadaceae bacterium]